jgi:hypothetical protein
MLPSFKGTLIALLSFEVLCAFHSVRASFSLILLIFTSAFRPLLLASIFPFEFQLIISKLIWSWFPWELLAWVLPVFPV